MRVNTQPTAIKVLIVFRFIDIHSNNDKKLEH